MKLCIVGNSELELFYKYVKEHMEKPEEKTQASVKECSEVYQKKLKE